MSVFTCDSAVGSLTDQRALLTVHVFSQCSQITKMYFLTVAWQFEMSNLCNSLNGI